MRNVTPWLVRRKPGSKNRFEVVSFATETGDPVIAKEFENLELAQQFAAEANLMIGRGGSFIKNL